MRAVIIGAGNVGFSIIDTLASERADVVALDVSQRRLDRITDLYDVQTVCASGSSPEGLSDAQVGSADMVVAVTDSDEVNLVACAIAAQKAPHSIRVARVRQAGLATDTALLGDDGFKVSRVINPERVTADRLVGIIGNPIAVDVAQLGDHHLLLGVKVSAHAPIHQKTFAEVRCLAPELKMLVITSIRGGISKVPRGNDTVEAGDVLYVVIAPDDCAALARLIGHSWRPTRRVTIAGGQGVGATLAGILEKRSTANIKLIEAQYPLANELAEQLSRVLVLHGRPTDENLLMEENIRDCDVFVAALSDEEANVMAALNAKRLGAHRVIALTNKTGYIPIIENAGVDAVISPKSLAIGTILQHIRKGRVMSVTPYGLAGNAEGIEFEALETAKAVGRPLKEVPVPQEAIIGLLIRGDQAIIPGGNDVIEPGDRVFVFADKGAIKSLEKLFTVSLSFF